MTGKETPKGSTLTLRLTADEAQLLEQLKAKTGRTSGSDLIKFLITNHEQMMEKYHEAIRLHTEEARKLTEAQRAIRAYFEASERLKALRLLE